MFYYPTVLRRHSGCFSTIWLVATKAIRISRRDFLKVDVQSTCDDIMSYLLEQVPPPRPGLPQPRFSLYLSSQLQYGVVVVFHRQCAMLLEELHYILVQLLKQTPSQKINIDDTSRPSLDIPDALSLLQETEGASAPLFGLMHMQQIMPSPTTLMRSLRGASPESPGPTSSPAASEPEPEPEPDRGITASSDSITLREAEPVTIPAAEFEGEDLEDRHLDYLDLLLAETDEFPEAGEREREREREAGQGEQDQDRPAELTGSPIELQPAAVEDGTLLPQEEPPPSEKPEPPTDELTPVPAPALPSPPPAPRTQESPSLPEVPASPKKTTRRRQLIFFDPETQIAQEVLQRQISDVVTETRCVPLQPPPSHRMVSAADLFASPCTPVLPPDVLLLWRQAATITPLSSLDLQVGERGPESTDSEKEKEQEMLESAEREETMPDLTQEVPRDVPESELLDISGLAPLPLEASDQREASREISPMLMSDREGSIASRSVSTLQDIPEVADDLGRIGSVGLLPELDEHEEAPVLFQSLLPPDADRKSVSVVFKRLLEALSSGQVQVEQKQPYGDILISPGN